jgi:hypothetical protein
MPVYVERDWHAVIRGEGMVRNPLRHASRAPGPRSGTDLRLNATSVRAQLALGEWLRTDEGAHFRSPLTTTEGTRTP